MKPSWRSGVLLGPAGLLLGLSVTGHPGVSSGPPAPVLLAGGVVGGVAGLALLFSPLARPKGVGLLLFLLFLGWGCLSARGTLDLYLSMATLSAYCGALGLFAALTLGVQTAGGWRRIAHLVVALALGTCAYGAATIQGALQATFTNPDCFSVLPVVGALLALGLISRARAGEREYLLLALVLLAISCFLTGSRSGLLGLLAGLGVFALRVGSGKGRRRWVLALALLTPPVLALAVLGSPMTAKWSSLLQGQDHLSLRGRLTVLRYGVATAAERPWLGTGPGTFALAYQDHRPQERAGEYMNVAHDDYLQLLVENGLPGLLLWCALLGWCLRQGWQADRHSRAERAGALAASTAVAVYVLGNFALPVPADLLYWVTALALCLPVESRTSWGRVSSLLGLVCLLAGLWGARVGGRIWQTDRALEKVWGCEEGLDWEGALAASEPLKGWPDPRLALARAWALQRLALFKGDDSLLEQALAEVRAARTRSPKDIVLMLRLAGLLESHKKYREAGEILALARAQTRHSNGLDRDVVRNLLLQGDLTDAAQKLADLRQDTDPCILGQLLALMETRHAGQGQKLLASWLKTPSSALVATACQAGLAAKGLGDVQAAGRFFQLGLKANPGDLACGLGMAEVEPSPKRKLATLERLLAVPSLQEGEALQVLTDWASLKIASHSEREVAPRLEVMLKAHPHQKGLRVLLSQAYIQMGRLTDAGDCLTAGITEDGDGTLRILLAEVYERRGCPDIAADYLEDALKLQPGNAGIKQNLERLRSLPVTP